MQPNNSNSWCHEAPVIIIGIMALYFCVHSLVGCILRTYDVMAYWCTIDESYIQQ